MDSRANCGRAEHLTSAMILQMMMTILSVVLVAALAVALATSKIMAFQRTDKTVDFAPKIVQKFKIKYHFSHLKHTHV